MLGPDSKVGYRNKGMKERCTWFVMDLKVGKCCKTLECM